jgi:hypothetical protein
VGRRFEPDGAHPTDQRPVGHDPVGHLAFGVHRLASLGFHSRWGAEDQASTAGYRTFLLTAGWLRGCLTLMSNSAAPDTASSAGSQVADATVPMRPAPVPVWYFPAIGLALGVMPLALSLWPSIIRSVTIFLMLVAIRLLEVAYRRVTGAKPPGSVVGFGSWLSVAWIVVTLGLLVESYLLTLHHGGPWFAIAGSVLIVLAATGYGWLISESEER